MARDLHLDPLWQPADLGYPIPDSPHAVSVCLPTWQHVIGYEEQDPAVQKALQCGYPRFVCHPKVRELCQRIESENPGNQQVAVFPNEASARRCAAFLRRDEGEGVELLEPWPAYRIHPVAFPPALHQQAWNYWRFCGEIVSSRQAEAALTQRAVTSSDSPEPRLRERLGNWSGQPAANIFLFPSGMAAIFALHQAALHHRPEAATIQLEFPYVDAMRIQQHFGQVHFFQNQADGTTSKNISDLLDRETIAAIFCETPSNPLLQTADLPRIAAEAAHREVPIFVDDTVATVHNIDVTPFADAITTSLTKNVSGQGDVMAGAVTVRKGSPFETVLCDYLKRR
ncbi:MAG: PLP-dependent transferase, partial [Verrucomicrobiota bacterium]